MIDLKSIALCVLGGLTFFTVGTRYSGSIPSTNYAVKVHPDPGNVYRSQEDVIIPPGLTTITLALAVDIDGQLGHDGRHPYLRIYLTDIEGTFMPQNDAFYGNVSYQIEDSLGNVWWTWRNSRHPDEGTRTGECTYHAREHFQTPIVMDVSEVPLYVRATWEMPTTLFGVPEKVRFAWLGRVVSYP